MADLLNNIFSLGKTPFAMFAEATTAILAIIAALTAAGIKISGELRKWFIVEQIAKGNPQIIQVFGRSALPSVRDLLKDGTSPRRHAARRARP